MAGRRGNNEGSIVERPERGKKKWMARITANSERKTDYFETYPEAQDWLLQMRLTIKQGLPIPDENQTFGDYLEDWLIAKKLTASPTYWERLEEYVRLHIKPTLGKIPLVKLTPQMLQALYAQKLNAGAADNSVKHLHNAIHLALEDAVQLDLIIRNVADRVKAPRVGHYEMQYYKPEEAMRFLAAAEGSRLQSMFVLMTTTGCRLGELLGLRWEALDLERGEMRITSVLKEVKGTRWLDNPKTPRSRRTIPLTDLAVDLLRQHEVDQRNERLPHGDSWNKDHLVFCTTTGRCYTRTNWRLQHYERLVAKAGLPYINPHGIRHTAATLLLLAGVQPHVVSEMLGHASVGFTLSTYGHVLAEMRLPARDAMQSLFGGMYEPSRSLAANPGK